MPTCLIPDKIQEFKKALKEKELNISDLLNMTTEERTSILSKYAGDNAKAANTLFEEKLVLKNRMQGIKNWAGKMGEIGKYSPMGKEELAKALSDYRARQQERIFSPQENEAFLNDLADKRLGVHISREVAQQVFDKTQKIEELKGKSTNLSGVSSDELKAREDLNNFVKSQNPPSISASIAKNLIILGRNNLLLNPSTPIKAVAGQLVNSVMDFATRRIGALSLRGGNSELVSRANSEAWKTFKETGRNTTAMENINDTHVLGKGEDFEFPAKAGMGGKISSSVETAIRRTAQLSNRIAIDWEHNVAFTKFYQKTFFDMANLTSLGIAKNEGLAGKDATIRAAEIFKDAARIEPKTVEGAMVRLEAQKQSARITSTNDSVVSRFSLGVKKALNKVIPGFPLGDLILPIAKIPASIIANGIDNAGAGLPKGVVDIFKGREKIQSTDSPTRYEGMAQFASGIQRLARIGGTLATAALIASQFKKEDFKTDNYGGHFVRIGKVWINTEYISAISPALAGFMLIKATGKGGTIEKTGQYIAGAGASLESAPGIDEASSLIKSITSSDYTKGIKKYATDFFTSRGEPAFIANLLKNRPIDRLFFGAHGVETEQQVKQDVADKAKAAALAKKKK